MAYRGQAAGVCAGQLLEKGVACVSPELSLASFDEFLTGEEIGGAPVVNQRGELRGIASKTDIVRFLATEAGLPTEELLGGATVSDIMTADVVTVGPDELLSEVARKMIDNSVHRVIVAEGDEIKGILTTFDLLRLLI